MKLIVLSFPKCATKSTALAAKRLLRDDAVVMPLGIADDHNYVVGTQWDCNHAEVWAGHHRDLWAQRVQSYNVVHDIPFLYCYQEIATMHSDAVFVLVERDGDAWFDSLKAYQDVKGAVNRDILRDWFGVRRVDEQHRHACIRVMQKHNDDVKLYFAGNDRLLTLAMPLTARDYGKLAGFLAQKVSENTSFPEIHTAKNLSSIRSLFDDPEAQERALPPPIVNNAPTRTSPTRTSPTPTSPTPTPPTPTPPIQRVDGAHRTPVLQNKRRRLGLQKR